MWLTSCYIANFFFFKQKTAYDLRIRDWSADVCSSGLTATVTTIAHWVLATRQILDDVAMLQSYIDGRLRYGLAYAEELQLLNGDGTGTNLNGVYTQATTFASPLAAANADLDTKVD